MLKGNKIVKWNIKDLFDRIGGFSECMKLLDFLRRGFIR